MTGAIVIASGGTGGHMFPALAVSDELARRGAPVFLVTDRRGARYLKPGLPHAEVSAGSPTGSLAAKAVGIANLVRGSVESVILFRRLRPRAAAAFGGYASVPAAVAAAATGVPLLVHEQNAVLGKANRLLARFAKVLALSFAETDHLPQSGRPAVMAGNPVRPGFGAESDYSPPEPSGPVRLLVMGGSQGARVFSDVLPAAMALLPDGLRRRIQLTQQCRPEDLERAREAYAALGMSPELSSFFDDAPARMAAAHLVLTRSGASTVAELLALGRPSLLVPYLYAADDHQHANARRLEAGGAARVIAQPEFTPDRLAAALQDLLAEPTVLAGMASAARNLARPDAASRLADCVLSMSGGPTP